jgi:hypothetical protein
LPHINFLLQKPIKEGALHIHLVQPKSFSHRKG